MRSSAHLTPDIENDGGHSWDIDIKTSDTRKTADTDKFGPLLKFGLQNSVEE